MDKNKEMIIGFVLLIILIGMIYWGYQELLTSYENFEFSNVTLSTILDRQSQQLWDYEYTAKIVSTRLAQAEALLKEYKRENGKLRERIELLDAMEDLQEHISKLKDENKLVLKELEALKNAEKSTPSKNKITSRRAGQELIAKHRQELQSLIQDISSQMREFRNAEQKELDRIESQLGNNGYLLRDGQDCSTGKSPAISGSTVTIDVKFLP